MGDTVLALAATPDDPIVSVLTGGEPHSADSDVAPGGGRGADRRRARRRPPPRAGRHRAPVFYDPREGQMDRWLARGQLAVEMEAAVLYTLAALRGIEAVALMTISDMISGETSVRISRRGAAAGVRQMTDVACRICHRWLR